MVTIEIDPSEFDRINDILQTYMPIPLTTSTRRRSAVFTLVKSILFGLMQLAGIMLTLVGANLLTTKLEPFAVSKPYMGTNAVNSTLPFAENRLVNSTGNNPVNTSMPSEDLNIDFGCDEFKCWRTCVITEGEKSGEKSWCFTTPKPTEINYHRCIFMEECSSKWNCVHPCQTVHGQSN